MTELRKLRNKWSKSFQKGKINQKKYKHLGNAIKKWKIKIGGIFKLKNKGTLSWKNTHIHTHTKEEKEKRKGACDEG